MSRGRVNLKVHRTKFGNKVVSTEQWDVINCWMGRGYNNSAHLMIRFQDDWYKSRYASYDGKDDKLIICKRTSYGFYGKTNDYADIIEESDKKWLRKLFDDMKKAGDIS